MSITQDDEGVWNLWIDGELVDREQDPEHSPMADIYHWAENVMFYERKVHVDSWTRVSADGEQARYVAQVRGQ